MDTVYKNVPEILYEYIQNINLDISYIKLALKCWIQAIKNWNTVVMSCFV